LDQAGEVYTKQRAKKLVAECTKKHRLGHKEYDPLMPAVEQRLRLFIGEQHWRKSMVLLRHYYLTTKQQRQQQQQQSQQQK
jgi:hypothetical protein